MRHCTPVAKSRQTRANWASQDNNQGMLVSWHETCTVLTLSDPETGLVKRDAISH